MNLYESIEDFFVRDFPDYKNNPNKYYYTLSLILKINIQDEVAQEYWTGGALIDRYDLYFKDRYKELIDGYIRKRLEDGPFSFWRIITKDYPVQLDWELWAELADPQRRISRIKIKFDIYKHNLGYYEISV